MQTIAGESLPGATIFIKGTFIGTATNQVGQFALNASFAAGAVELVVSYLGYETQVIKLSEPDLALDIRMVPSAALLSETVVSASRVEENILRAPVTVDKVSGRQLERISTPEILAGLGTLPGVDVNSASMLFTSISTRGFNTAKSERVIQLVDYMDTALPSLNLSPGNLVGIPELDMESIEIIHGPASALYGSNALSGVVLFNTKDPFVYEGLSVRLRGGERNLLDGQVRYAKKLNERFAFKLNASAFKAKDWIAKNYEPVSYSINPLGSPLGYDAVNRYGELPNTYSPFQDPGYTVNPELYGQTVYTPGYTEQELIADDEQTRSYRVQGAVSYLVNNDLKLTVEAKRGVGTSTYQNLSRFRMKGFGTNQYRAELKSTNSFIRIYSTEDFSGNSYEMDQLGYAIANSPGGGNLSYAQQYFFTYNQAYTAARDPRRPGGPLSMASAQAAAQAAANSTQLKPTDSQFTTLRNQGINNDKLSQGARLNFNSFLNDVSAQHSFKLGQGSTNLTVGGAYRQFRLGSGGKLFADTDDQRIVNYEYGGYGQLTRTLVDDHLKLSLAGRLDNFMNFSPSFSPRAAVVYSLGKNMQHNFRASYSKAFRSPTQLDQYLHADAASGILLGNVGNGFKGYGQINKDGEYYTLGAPLEGFEVTIEKLRLERVGTFEIGYKGAISSDVYVDASYFSSRYDDFIGGISFIGNVDGTRPTYQQVVDGYLSGFTDPSVSPARFIYTATNNSQEVHTQGATIGLTYYMSKAVNIGGNYSLNVLNKSSLPKGFITYFNTPKHKFNLLANGTVLRNLTYSVNYRWVEGHEQEMPFDIGRVSTYSTTDVYLGYAVPNLSTTFQAGVSNMFNGNNVQIIAGPQIGRVAYLGILLNVK
ncbi:TonB-dependent receptor [Hymenobacter sp. BT664]|uniref:TonB-dependent receptor n=1 Tax=Hymenobacter montanus TaxID=2771359 RepID=A0A927BHX7_9BACT|nr:TonB-dependent receptor [Hymenobacter montanus]MBD2770449.1 TonB-dependent receptor [Hymenobacter montanus]